jgi:hypothetical protein
MALPRNFHLLTERPEMARSRLSIHAAAYSKAVIEYCIQELILATL